MLWKRPKKIKIENTPETDPKYWYPKFPPRLLKKIKYSGLMYEAVCTVTKHTSRDNYLRLGYTQGTLKKWMKHSN